MTNGFEYDKDHITEPTPIDMNAWMQTQGFRCEFNGIPVLGRNTGNTFTEYCHRDRYGPGEYLYKEYMVLESYDDKIWLKCYTGPAGVRDNSIAEGWTGKAKLIILHCFLKLGRKNPEEI